MRDRSKVTSEARSALMGRIVDSYTNILTVKLFARPRDEDDYVRDAIEYHTGRFLAQQRLITAFGTILAMLNALLVAGAGALALLLWRYGKVEVGAIAMVLPLTFQLTNMSRWIALQVTDIFEKVGVVQEGMMTIAQPLQLVDRPDAQPLAVQRGRDRVRGRALRLRPRDRRARRLHARRSGRARRSAWSAAPAPASRRVVNLLLRFFDLEGGRILIDGQDIAGSDAGRACARRSRW